MNPQQQEALLYLRRLLETPESDPAEIAGSYVTVISEQLLLFAAQSYKRDGIGVIEIDLRGIDLRTATGTAPIAYYPADAGSDEWPPNLEAILNDYDPAHEAVVLLFQDRAVAQIFVLG
ncbi:hypothetical protein EYB53_014020 [Candidatus Chloroploca sp. M-50]|uniref:Uncharacterized protein n=1 Tax=Candidatus Chloroploca mongolica TaxID=2528176 RepID=A0ABS4DBK7_9CHLR|nr:hypothetical protein [Candidatus Chloroploca mongolica]MBP1466826.1 hypothetical protein [Candidatus Chloroploca mongolica]